MFVSCRVQLRKNILLLVYDYDVPHCCISRSISDLPKCQHTNNLCKYQVIFE